MNESCQRRVAAACWLAAVLLAMPAVAAAEPNRVEFRESFVGALIDADQLDRKVAVYFWGPDCKWCQKFQSVTLADPAVQAAAQDYIWVRPPPEDAVVLAARYGVAGTPAVLLLDARGQLLARCDGYLAPKEFAELLRKARDETAESPQDRLDALMGNYLQATRPGADPNEVRRSVHDLLEMLADPANEGRLAVAGAAIWSPRSVRVALCDELTSPKLRLRAAAYNALADQKHSDLPYDPFADPQVRTRQADAWRRAVQAEADSPATPEPMIEPLREDLP